MTLLLCALVGGCDAGEPSDSEAKAALRAAGIGDKPVCFLSAVDFPYSPSGFFAMLSPDTAIAERLSRLGLLTIYRDAGSGSVRFDLTDAGKAAWSSGAKDSPERGFCAGAVRITDVRTEQPAGESNGVRTQTITFAMRPVASTSAKWAARPEALQFFPELAVFTRIAELPPRVQVRMRHTPETGWRAVSGLEPAPASTSSRQPPSR